MQKSTRSSLCAAQPLVSLLIATRNEADTVVGCLDALAAQTYPRAHLELIVIDGCSEDGTAARVRAWSDGAAVPVRLLENPRRSTPAAFNRGLGTARGEVVIILGAHTRPAPDFVAMSVAALIRTGADAVGGVVRSVGDQPGALARAIGLAQRSPFGVGDARYRYATSQSEVDTVNYGAYRRAVFARIGGFDEAMLWVEDDELNYRLRAAGGRLVLDPAIQIDYLARPSLRGLALQRYRWGRNKLKVALKHPRQMRPRQAVPGLFVSALGVGVALWPCGGSRRRLLPVTLTAYAAATALATVQSGARHGWRRQTALLPLPFAVMHLAYGLGTLVGTMGLAGKYRGGWPFRACATRTTAHG